MKKTMKSFISFILSAAILTSVAIFPVPAGAIATKVSLNKSNDAGDCCYFDSNYCYTSANAQYKNVEVQMGNNYIEFYRLDYTNPKRESFMYAERLQEDTYCFFTVNLSRPTVSRYTSKIYSYFLINADIMTTVYECESQMFLIRTTTDSSGEELCLATLGTDGRFTFSDGTKSDVLVKKGEWANYKIGINLESHTADIYFNGEKIKASLSIPSSFTNIKQVRFRLMEGGTGNMYLDNFQITGLIKPFVDGVETPTDIYPEEDDIKSFLSGKVAFHGYSGLVYKNGVKRPMDFHPVYDEKNQELYVCSSEIKKAFGISDIAASSDGSVTYDGVTKNMGTAPVVKDGVTYIPVKAFSENALGKYVDSFQTGYFIVGDKNEYLNTDGWVYQSFRSDSSQITMWNDVDFVNAFLQYRRPDASALKEDFERVNGYSHPRILVSKSDFDRMRNYYQTDEKYKKMAEKTLRTAKTYLNRGVAEYKYDDAMRMLNTAREVYNRFLYLGYAWQITGDSKYADRAYEEICNLDTFPDFNTSHIIDAGEYAMALAIAYDWFYDAFTDEQREFAARVCVEKGLKPLASGMYGRLTSTSNGTNAYGSFRWRSNYNAIVVGGCINAAISAIEYDPDYCFEIVENCLKGYEYTLAELMPGGGWNEAPGYWNYAMQYLDVGLSTLNVAFGSDYCLSKSMGMEETLKFAIATLGVTGPNNFHDMGLGSNSSYSEFSYLSSLYGNKTAYEMRLNEIYSKSTATVNDLLYYRTDGYGDDTNEAENVNYIKGVELFSVRDSFNKEEGKFFFSTHYGTTSGYHQHNDCSSFVLDIDGIRWAEDLGSEDYNLQNELGYPEYSLYRKRAEGHNVMVINPANYSASMEQRTGQFIPVTQYDYDEKDAYVKADMSNVYNGIIKMESGYYTDRENQTVTMRNEFEPTEANSEVYWFMHTKADVSVVDNVAYLTRAGETVKVEFETNAQSAEIMKMSAAPLPTSPQVPEQNTNGAYSKVAIKLNASGYTELTVKISPNEDTSDMMLLPLKDWHLLSKSENDVVLFEGKCKDDFGSFVRGDLTDSVSVGGKDSADKSVAVAMNTAENENNYNSYYNYTWGTSDKNGNWTEAGGDGYLIMKANVFTLLGTTAFTIRTDQGASISKTFTPGANQWHNIAVIYDRAAGKSKTIIDGQESEYEDCALGKPRSDSAQIRNNIRFTMQAKAQGDVMYIDDVKIYTSGTDFIPSLPELKGNFRTEGNLLQAESGLTVDTIKSKCPYIVNVFADNTYSQRLTADTELYDGNAVVLCDDNMLYNTYFVTGNKLHIPTNYRINQINGFASPAITVVRADCSSSYSTGGKSAADEAMYLVGNDSTSTNDYYLQYAFSEADCVYDTAMSMDIYINKSTEFKSFKFATGVHTALSSEYDTSKLAAGSWHNVAIIHRAADNTNEIYIDGTLVQTKTLALSSRVIRCIFNPISKILGENNSTKVYLDNINYMCGEDIIINPLVSGTYTVNGAYITGATGKTVKQFKENVDKASTAFVPEVYNADGTLASDSTAISAGMFVYVKEKGYIARQYYFK